MLEFRINLLRGQVLSPARRRARYAGMLVYLALAGAVLALALAISTTRMVRAEMVREDIGRIERSFAEAHPNALGIAPHAAQIERTLQRRLDTLRAVDRQLTACPRPATLLYRLSGSLPPGVTLRTFALDATSGEVTFELLAASDAGAPDVIRHWNEDAKVRTQLREITYLGSQRQTDGTSEAVVWRFAARLAQGES